MHSYVGDFPKGREKGEKLVHQQGLAEFSRNGDKVGGQSTVSGLLQYCGWD